MAKTKKIKPLKTYVITVSVNFPKKGIVKPKPTGFKKKILSGEKKHTIRVNYDFWKKRIDEINSGKAILSVRQWSGLPYRSEQVEIAKFTKLGYQKITVDRKAEEVTFHKENDTPYLVMSNKRIKTLAKNDGLEIKDFQDWFSEGLYYGIIIHFTKLRY